MIELIFFVVVLLGIVLIDGRLHRLVKIQRDALTELRECETHLQVMCEAYKANRSIFHCTLTKSAPAKIIAASV
jgi:hypothetical protein